eukprot:scaffold31789_cov36-Phaeocystis_antarctica.AAC.1
MVLSRLLVASPYNGSITVPTPAPRDHPPAFFRYRLPRAPETCTPFTRGCMTSEPETRLVSSGCRGPSQIFQGVAAWGEGLYGG